MIDSTLKELGFTGFVHINPKKRDDRLRKAWSGVYKDRLIFFRIIYLEGSWELEDISSDFFDNDLQNLMSDRKNIDQLLVFIEKLQK